MKPKFVGILRRGLTMRSPAPGNSIPGGQGNGCVMIHWSRVNELRDEVGAEDFDEVVELFLEEVEEVIERLRNGPDTVQLEQDLHFLKGSALSLGFAAFSDLCQDGEQKSASGEADKVDVPKIIDGFDRSKSEFVTNLQDKLAQ